jgi:glutamate N-acetyltransferase/amino-acid N-acetyltransferase
MKFKFSSASSSIKYSDRDDTALLYADFPCNVSALFTKNKVKAAPVKLSMERTNNKIQAILVNSGNANACTGQSGYETARKLAQKTAIGLKIDEESVLTASTGTIGIHLPAARIEKSIPVLVETLDENKITDFAKAIMTTDTVEKVEQISFSDEKNRYTMKAVAKGSGMIAPDMATLLVFIVCDAPIPKTTMDKIFKEIIDSTLNSLSIDGDMSTNDSAFLLCPSSGLTISEKTINEFEKSLKTILVNLSNKLIDDGEGATKRVTIEVKNAKTVDDAKKASRSIAESLLVKTALFGNDPNWGRVACAAGYSGADFDPDKMSISIGPYILFENGSVCVFNSSEVTKYISQQNYTITVILNAGEFSWKFLTSDISYEYVKINAEYTT